ncbi:hypothetical protein ACWD4P_22355 [Kitasatospora sp. NPDC002543]
MRPPHGLPGAPGGGVPSAVAAQRSCLAACFGLRLRDVPAPSRPEARFDA